MSERFNLSDSERFSLTDETVTYGLTFWDNGKELSDKEVVDLLNKQQEIINNIEKKIDDYLLEIKYQIERGTELKDTYVRYGRFKQILLELKGELE